ncbi:hypothetical protein JCGZ_06222 [Jatropha curcas]|uniref:Fe2OG dioxygenase domain-containing protein n=2 Tax=Jatropha curcas TaxID=180498 RepID=A0A067KLP4_JATCU|nr:hypothetical protein JCGZ_06222 [Jatropha curcas]
MQNVSKIPNGGYIGKSSITPLCESIGIDDPNSLEKVQTFTNAFWPQGKSSFSKAIHSFSNQISELGERIRRMILESLGMQKYLDEHMDSSISKIRIIKYEMAKENEPKLALASHMDASIITILYQNQVDGLEIQTKSGEWISVNLSPHNFFVLIGESFHAWTNGRLHSPYHRVTVKGNDEERYTIGLFTIFKPGYTIKAPEELVDEQHPLLYRPFDILDVLQRHQALKNNQSQQNVFVPLKAYFGVV